MSETVSICEHVTPIREYAKDEREVGGSEKENERRNSLAVLVVVEKRSVRTSLAAPRTVFARRIDSLLARQIYSAHVSAIGSFLAIALTPRGEGTRLR